MNFLYIYLESLSPVQETIEMSRAISELGILVTLAGLMIIMFISAMIFIFRIVRNTNEKIIESQARGEKQNDQIILQNDTIKELLAKIAEAESVEALREQSEWNAKKILKMSFDTNMNTLLKGAADILLQNHITDKEFTESRIRSLVKSAHSDRIQSLNTFRYKGSRLGDLANSESWIDKKVDIIRNFIYSTDKNRDSLFRDLSLAYIEFNNQLELQ